MYGRPIRSSKLGVKRRNSTKLDAKRRKKDASSDFAPFFAVFVVCSARQDVPLYIQRFSAEVVSDPDPDATGCGGKGFLLPFE
jgi:hypothetical protein